MADTKVPEFEPAEFVAGESLAWTKELDGRPASEWALKYYFRGAGTGFDVTAEADGDAHAVAVAAATTGAMTPGVYYWQAVAEKGEERVVVADGRVTVRAGLSAIAAGAGFDGRSKVKKILDAIDGVLEGRASADVQMYTIGNRQLTKIPVDQLLAFRKYYATLYAQELRRARVRRGGSFLKNIEVGFDKS